MEYKNFDLAIYCTVFEALHSEKAGIEALEREFSFIEKHLKCSKVYLETYRGGFYADKEHMLKMKDFFNSKGIKTSGGITTTSGGKKEGFDSFCYTNEEHKKRLKEVVQFTAELFDEIIVDDFYFTNCKCESCIKEKGNRSWAEFRTELLKSISEEVMIKPAKEVNPNVNMIIKYPNWYEHYQNVGYNLKDGPQQFDMIYTGTETRDPEYTQQHLQRYLSYFLMRYMENVKPGKNGGGWFDPFDCIYNIGSYVEQAYLTLFSKPKEVTLFCLGALLNREKIFVPVAGYVFDMVDQFLDQLGGPVGVSCYKPYHSSGEDHLYDYLGMLGIPLEPTPQFPYESPMTLLTASASQDEDIVDKIKGQLKSGKTVVITSGLLKALQDRGIEDIILCKYTDKKATVNNFAYKTQMCAYRNYYEASKAIMIPQLEYSTNDSWSLIVGLSENNNFPILLKVEYGQGELYVLTIPENCGDLYHLPMEILKPIRELLTKELSVTLDCGSKVGLFVYDNDTFIVESFLSHNTDVGITLNKTDVKLVDLASKQELSGNIINGKTVFNINIYPNTFRAYKCESLK